ncbi:MAG: serine/threonine protein kinase, partial [Desulfobacteraceae bacterium]|nr:serine/threonine protein kinase [Desulfobacteraceae bacterium]
MKNKKEKPRTLTMGGMKRSSKDKKATQTISPIVVTPEVIGNYRLLQRLGVGGMGEVYEAEQVKPIQRKVALKLIKWGMDTKQVIARFESERQALALMNHTNIAKVYDAGATEKGRPYFVMEHVKGVRINDYCDKTRMDTSERLKLFTQVCDGVQHAHQKGIIHRDIKASNVLVTIQDDKPVPKIIDFGVAKATAQRLTERTVFTEMGQLIGTPEYMSPEQAEMTGLDVDTRTDVYSLGVLLYELLVGVLPFEPEELRKGGFDEIRRKVREEEPPKPSTRLTTPGFNTKHATQSRRTDLSTLTKQLKGELDW